MALWLIVFLFKSISVWLVGIGLKIMLYDPDAPGDAFFSIDQRLQLSASCAACYFFGGLMYSVHRPGPISRWYVAWLAVWAGLVAGMVLLAWTEMPAYTFLRCQCLLGFAHMLLTQLQCVWLPACGWDMSPLEEAHTHAKATH